MLKLLLFDKSQHFFENIANENVIDAIITPSPQIADLVRKQMLVYGKKVRTITISKYIKNELSGFFEEDVEKRFKGKSDLILYLGAIWKKVGLEKKMSTFKQAFNLLTEFRSYSTSQEVLENVLENYEQSLGEGVLWLHRFIEELEIIDEHGSYFLLAEKLRESEFAESNLSNKNLAFFGFDFLTGSQLDLLKSLSLHHTVYLPYYKRPYETASSFDWIKWMSFEEIIDLTSQKVNENEKKFPLKRFPKNYLSQTLSCLPLEFDNSDIVLASKNLSREEAQEVSSGAFRLKASVDLFSDVFSQVGEELLMEIGQNRVAFEQLSSCLKEWMNEAVQECNYRKLKCYLLLQKKCSEWSDLSEENQVLDEFDAKVILDSCRLDLPRINMANLEKRDLRYVYSLGDIEQLKGQKIVFAFNSNHDGINYSSTRYTENVEKYLSSIGPIRRGELEKEIFHAKFKEFIFDNDVAFLIEDGLIEHHLTIANLFHDLKFKLLNLVKPKKTIRQYYKPIDDFSSVTSISASKLQSYYDCPRNYYLKYVEKLSPQINISYEMKPQDLGKIEHEVIEHYLNSFPEYDQKGHFETIEQVLLSYEKKYSAKIILNSVPEIKAYTQRTIQSLIDLKKELKLETFFEYSFDNSKDGLSCRGSIDFFGKSNDIVIILDFKRSHFTFSSLKMITDFEQLQLWFYALQLRLMGVITNKTKIVLGYVDLSQVENSTLISNDYDLFGKVQGYTGFEKGKVIDDLYTQINHFEKNQENLLLKLKKEEEFNPKPRKESVCQYCSLVNTCSKGAGK